MKPLAIYFILILILLGMASRMEGQTSHSASSPAFINHIYYSLSDSLISLEQNGARMESKTKAMGYGGSEGGFYMDGAKSNMRIHASDSIRFMVKMNMAMMDPSMMIKLYKFDSKNGNREAILSSQGGMFSGGKSKHTTSEISFNIMKSGSEDYIMMPASRLAPGEYGFINMMMANGGGRDASYTVFAFGVD
ncbi:MAG TPA: hypothetical protein VII28_03980 [Puia sp.]